MANDQICSHCKGSGMDDASGFGDFVECDECKGTGRMLKQSQSAATFSAWLDQIRAISGVNVRPESPPLYEDGVYFADIDLNMKTVVVQYSVSQPSPFGVSLLSEDTGYTSHPDQAFPSADLATEHIKTLFGL